MLSDGNSGEFTVTVRTQVGGDDVSKTFDVQYSGSTEMSDCEVSITEGLTMVDLIDVVLEGIKDVVDWFIGLFMDGLRSGYQTLTEEMFGTPTPQRPTGRSFSENQVMPLGQQSKRG